MDSLWWFVGAAVLGAIEIFTLDLTFLMLAGGALAGGVVILAGGPVVLAAVVALVVAALLMMALRPWLLRSLRKRGVDLIETNINAVAGTKARTIDVITETSGRIKLRGEVWTARIVDDAAVIPEGAEVIVTKIVGATAIVVPEEEYTA
ncbi:NfeD family protein [Demequina sp. TTPB684]|uniref:NfeD family protein n=1 Tax=unclassified Demequina TaxID=2620311 RepID=UPI001CF203A0|nr:MULTISPECIES: NfeD family protein [unclassified Demequina]MCB2413901.1 NfeD family protein [Demequina sp. TTPB684]UPU89411.1 NfeD family protein [Demequina sp. TMPB413]